MPPRYGQDPSMRTDDFRDIVLTFDDGPNPATTPALLDTLAKNEIKAVFFVLGERLTGTPAEDTIRRIVAEGHVVGNHTFSHANLRKLEQGKVADEIKRTHDLICKFTNECNLFRPPYGATNGLVAQVLQELGYQQVLWNVDTMDWKYKQEGKWVDYGMDQVKARQDCIVLMHDIHRSTVDNVPKLIDRINRLKNVRFALY